MNNKGLEALAALASASSHRNDTSGSHGSSSSGESNVRQPPAAPATTAQPTIDFQSIVHLTTALQQQQQGSRNTASINQQILTQALNSGLNPAALATLLQGLSQPNVGVFSNNNNNNTQQQQSFDWMNILANAQSGQQQQLPVNNPFGALPSLQNQALQMLLSGRSGAAVDDRNGPSAQVLPRSSAQTSSSPNRMPLTTGSSTSTTAATITSKNNMPPPQPSNLQASVGSLPHVDHDSSGNYSDEEPEGKKQMKRAANRKSAQLSRKRKKQFIEELKEENDGLRRKEQILRSIPDLVVVFDSSGKLWFVSESVERFLSFTASELEGTSFWDRLSPESVRILKAAFMDSLAAREDVSDTVQLGTGVWELELVDKSNTNKRVSLNGVVHFAGERPECVCSIRPLDSNNHGGFTEETTEQQQQQIMSSKPKVLADNERKRRKRGDATRISDSGNSSSGGESESDETGGQ